MNDQELFMQAQQIGQELDRVVKHKKAVEEEMLSSQNFLDQVSNFPKTENKILTPLSHGVYARSVLEKKDFLVQVGAGILVERSISEVKELLERNLAQMSNAVMQLRAQEEFYTGQLQQLLSIAEENQKSK